MPRPDGQYHQVSELRTHGVANADISDLGEVVTGNAAFYSRIGL